MTKNKADLKQVPINEFQKYFDYYLDYVDKHNVPIIIFDPQGQDKSVVLLPLGQYQNVAKDIKNKK